MEERIERQDIEKLLKEIKIRMGSEDDLLGIIEKHPVAVLLAAFGTGVILSQIDDFLIEKVETGKSCPAIEGIMKVGLPLIMKKFIR
ncbi:MAG TPA: hypothetical protein PLI06_01495 [Methanofastidiosum sp.]|nr:hypothetical protein [Methanofastidiosum sp.]HNU60627.1 hypothetical protein [Methanofastidiosum sp.]HOI76273.1 hypothetical protein [Methanofastidiosum sp.]